MNEVKWDEHFGIGVAIIDNAHKKLFSIVSKLLNLTEDAEKQQHACREGIKYLKSYTARHFAEEEDYMRQINYADYELHKKLHDNMQYRTIPALEQELESHNYSAESIQHFLGMCVGWLNCHIMIEDRAIGGKTPHKWMHQPEENRLDSLKKSIIQTFHALFSLNVDLVSAHYSGEDFASGNALCYRLTYRTSPTAVTQVFLIYEARMILMVLSGLLGKQINKIDKTVAEAMKIISQKFMTCMETHFALGDSYQFEKINTLSFEQFVHSLDKQYPPYSLLFCSERNNYFAFCIN